MTSFSYLIGFGEGGIRTHERLWYGASVLAGRPFRPLRHLSMFGGVSPIRTDGGISATTVFRTDGLDHSPITPYYLMVTRPRADRGPTESKSVVQIRYTTEPLNLAF